MKKKPGKRPPMTEEEKAARAKLREELKDKLPPMALRSVGNRGPSPDKYTDEFIAKVATDILKWSAHPEAYFIDDFCGDYLPSITRTAIIEFANKDNVFAQTLELVKRRLISRLDRLALNKKIDGNYLSKIKPLIDKEYREWRLTELKAETQDANKGVINVTINPGKGLVEEPVKTIEVKE